MSQAKILVTGGTGYIGSHTVVELIRGGYEVIVADNLSNSKIEVLEAISQITGVEPAFQKIDLCDRAQFESLIQKYDTIDAVIHFAAYKAVGESVKSPLAYYHNNLLSLIHLLELMQQYAIRHMVFSSSCTVYGQPETLPVTEQAAVQPAMSPYGNTKQVSEEIIRDTVSAGSMNGIALRYFNPVGAHPSALMGELPLGVPNNLVPFITQTAMGIREQLSVFGDDYNTPDGSCIRDYIHVVDLAKAHVVAVNRLLGKKNKAVFETFNLGTGRGVSVLEMIRAFEKVSHVRLNYKIVGRRPGDIDQVWADTSYANRELGWKAESSLEETLLSAWNWEKHYKECGGWK